MTMRTYANLGGDSNVVSFEIGADYIVVEFGSGRCTIYRYTYSSAGREAVEEMKRLALAGEGLNSYIKINEPHYVSKQ